MHEICSFIPSPWNIPACEAIRRRLGSSISATYPDKQAGSVGSVQNYQLDLYRKFHPGAAAAINFFEFATKTGRTIGANASVGENSKKKKKFRDCSVIAPAGWVYSLQVVV